MNTAQYILIITLAATLVLPYLFAGVFFNQWFPYHLTGKQFLVFYLIYMLACYAVLLFGRIKHTSHPQKKFMAKALVCFTLIIASSRTVQGISNHKPVSYLVVLTLVHLLILLWSIFATRKSLP